MSRQDDYLNLIQSLLSCPSGEENQLLEANAELVDRDLVQMIVAVAQILSERGDENAVHNLHSIVPKLAHWLESIELTLPQKLEADLLLTQGFAHFKSSQFDRAFQSYQQALTLYQKINDRRGEAGSIVNLGSVCQCLGDYQQAVIFYKQSLSIARNIGNRQEEANSLGNLGLAHSSLGQYQRAIACHKRSFEIKREIGNREGEARSLGNLGNVYRSLGQYQEAINVQQQSLDINREIGNREGEANSLGNLGVSYHFLGKYQQANFYLNQSLSILKSLGDRLGKGEKATCLLWLGHNHNSLGEYERAIELHEQALDLFQKIGDRNGEGNSLGGLGNAYQSLGQHQKAMKVHQQSLEIARKISHRSDEAASLSNLGSVYRSLGQYKQAVKNFQQSLEIDRKIGNRDGEAGSLSNLGLVYHYLGQYQQAVENFQQSLQVLREIGNRGGEAIVLGNLGLVYRALGKYQDAIKFHQQSLNISQDIKRASGQITSLNNLATVYQDLKRYSDAIDVYQACLQQSPANLFPVEHLLAGQNLGNLALRLGQWETAITGYEAALAALEKSCSFETSERAKQRKREENVAVYENLVRCYVEVENLPKALETVERSKSRNLVETIANLQILPDNTPEELCREFDDVRRRLQANQRILENLSDRNGQGLDTPESGSRSPGASPQMDDFLSGIREAVVRDSEAMTQLLAQIATYDPGFQLTQQVKAIRFAEIEELIDENTVIVEWYIGGDNIYAFVVSRTGDRPVKLVTSDRVSELTQLRDRYLELYRENKQEWRSQLSSFLTELAAILNLEEIITNIPKTCDTVIFVPYRELYLFPLHALPVSPSSRPSGALRNTEAPPPSYTRQSLDDRVPWQSQRNEGMEDNLLVDRFPGGVRYSPSCQLLQLAQKYDRPSASPSTLFAIQNPTEDLQYTDVEVTAICRYFQDVKVLPGSEATKRELETQPNKDRFRNAQHLHFACHGSFNFSEPLFSNLILADGVIKVKAESSAEPAKSRYVPWRKGNAIDLEQCYTLGEIFALNLPQCRLATLSACETGLTQFNVQMEEYIGLPSGFICAGSKSVLCSLWAVDDRATAILMVKFYQCFHETRSVYKALYAAQLWLRSATQEQLLEWLETAEIEKQKKRELKRWLKVQDRYPCQSVAQWGAFCAIGA